MKINNVKEVDLLKTVTDDVGQCCSNKPIYETTYSLGKKWLVCNECLDIECFSTDIIEKERIKQ